MLLELAPGGHLYQLLCDKPPGRLFSIFSGRVGGSVSFAMERRPAAPEDI